MTHKMDIHSILWGFFCVLQDGVTFVLSILWYNKEVLGEIKYDKKVYAVL